MMSYIPRVSSVLSIHMGGTLFSVHACVFLGGLWFGRGREEKSKQASKKEGGLSSF